MITVILVAMFLVPVDKPVEFKQAFLQQIDAKGKTSEVECVIRFDDDAVTVTQRKSPYNRKPGPPVTMKYADIAGATAASRKDPNIGAAVAVNPLWMGASYTKQFLTLKTKDGYAILRLDRHNYLFVLAELEKRTGISIGR